MTAIHKPLMLPLMGAGSVMAGVWLSHQIAPTPVAVRLIREPIRWVSVQAVLDKAQSTQTAKDNSSTQSQANLNANLNLDKPTPQHSITPVANLATHSDLNTSSKPVAKPVIDQTLTPKQDKKPVINQMAKPLAVANSSTQKRKEEPKIEQNSQLAQTFELPKSKNKTAQPSEKPNVSTQTRHPTATTNTKTDNQLSLTNHPVNTQNAVKPEKSSTTETPPPVANKPTPKPDKQPTPDNSSQWQAQFITAVNRHKSYPNNARKTGIEGSVLLAVHVMATGDIHCCEIKQSSGSTLLDNAAMQAAQQAVSQTCGRLQTTRDFGFDFYVDFVLGQ